MATSSLNNNVKTLKLDISYRPIEIVDAVDALVLCLIGKAQAIENYTSEIKSVSESFKLPAVIVLKRFVKFHFQIVSAHRREIILRDNNQCQYCSIELPSDKLTLDHIVPKSKGGKNTWDNLVAACKKCNQKKGNRTPEQANMKLICKPVKPKYNILRSVGKNQVSELWKNYLWESNGN
jgi:5-methylcytosine-specific restriction endonuclease McrA|tara:strand:+ start:7693 stop:8229 length:537 start_codon:yes stop_codon:yes gene_type:complete